VISFRYHVVSLVAVFLALALGVVVGTTALNGPITTNLRQQVDSLKNERTSLAGQNRTLQSNADNANQFAASFGPKIVASTLKNRRVVIIGMPGAASGIKDGTSKEIVAAGGVVTGRIQLTSDYTDPRRGNDIKSLVTAVHPIGLTLPAVDDAGVLAGSLLGFVLLSERAQQTDIEQVMAGFASLQMLKVESGDVSAADLAVVVSSGTLPLADAGGIDQLSLVTGLQQTKAQADTVVAGDTESSTLGGLVALVRSNNKVAVSTVDDADTAMGQVATVLALTEAAAGKDGAYGTGSGAQALFPAPSK
jgi:hypothetical protein